MGVEAPLKGWSAAASLRLVERGAPRLPLAGSTSMIVLPLAPASRYHMRPSGIQVGLRTTCWTSGLTL